MDDPIVAFIRSPWSLAFFVLIELILIVMVAGIFWIVKVGWPREAKKMSWYAMKVAKLAWYVHAAESFKDKGTVVELVTHTMPRQRLELYFRLGHPDHGIAALLERMDVVRFIALKEPVEGQLPFELAPHLRIIDSED